jgi:phosphatidylinositol alpha-1,6-mannosyltransferase
VEILPPPIDTETFSPGPDVGVHDENAPLVLLTVSRMGAEDWYKGHDVVIDALPLLNDRVDRPIEYWIVGEGALKAQLAARAKEIGCGRQVKFLGSLSQQALVEAYRRADLFVMPSCLARQPDGHSTGEGFGMVFVEAAACGTPAVGLADAGAREAIAHGVSGYVAATPEDIAPTLERLLTEHEFRRDLGKTAARWAAITFSHSVFDRQLDQIVKALIGPAA